MRQIYVSFLLGKTIGSFLERSVFFNKNELFVCFKKNALRALFFFFKKSTFLQAHQLLDIVAVDELVMELKEVSRFYLLYYMVSISSLFSFFLKTRLSFGFFLFSVFSFFSSSVWLERENWDMFGIYFYNNGDLRRILTDYGFEGHPLRKEYPQSGFYELRYDESFKCILSEPYEMTQLFRLFDFESSWERV